MNSSFFKSKSIATCKVVIPLSILLSHLVLKEKIFSDCNFDFEETIKRSCAIQFKTLVSFVKFEFFRGPPCM